MGILGTEPATELALPETGQVLDGKYALGRVLGEGGMGVVYEAMHLRLRQKCAIKILQPGVLKNDQVVARFEREARAAATIKNPNVVQVLDVDVTPQGLPYMVMELLQGHDLAEELDQRGQLSVAEASAYGITTCAALAQAHAKGIIHRDLKPSNLFLCEDDEGRRVLKLLDFGISKIKDEKEAAEVTSSITVIGTPFYMSPEQVRSLRSVDHRTDVWALGVVIYQLLTGNVPFGGSATAVVAAIAADPVRPPREIRSDIPEKLEMVIMTALEKDPARRFQDVRAFAEALLPFAPAGMTSLIDLRNPSSVSFPALSPRLPQSRPQLAYAETQDVGASTGIAPPVVEPLAPISLPSTGNRTAWSRPPVAPVGRHAKRIAIVAMLCVSIGVVAIFALRRATGTKSVPTAAPVEIAPETPTAIATSTSTASSPALESSLRAPASLPAAGRSRTLPAKPAASSPGRATRPAAPGSAATAATPGTTTNVAAPAPVPTNPLTL